MAEVPVVTITKEFPHFSRGNQFRRNVLSVSITDTHFDCETITADAVFKQSYIGITGIYLFVESAKGDGSAKKYRVSLDADSDLDEALPGGKWVSFTEGWEVTELLDAANKTWTLQLRADSAEDEGPVSIIVTS